MQIIERQENLSFFARQKFDEVIDVRSPSEFAEDHIPGAINLPVLNDSEREEVGTIYRQQSKQVARRIGAAYATSNISRFLSGYFSSKPNTYRPLVYCWRGGMRSQSMATILNSVGWYTNVVENGYRSWRNEVVLRLRTTPLAYRFILIDGQTGAGKTKILHELANLGSQILDIEKLANHRGSVFGSLQDNKQPTQKYFESLVFDALDRLDPTQVIFVEAESPKIGRRAIPKTLVDEMRRSPRIELCADLENRADNLVACYADLIAAPARLASAIEFLRPFHATDTVNKWQTLASEQQYRILAEDLIARHYDPCYLRQRRKRRDKPLAHVTVSGFLKENLVDTAQQLRKIAETQVAMTSAINHTTVEQFA